MRIRYLLFGIALFFALPAAAEAVCTIQQPVCSFVGGAPRVTLTWGPLSQCGGNAMERGVNPWNPNSYWDPLTLRKLFYPAQCGSFWCGPRAFGSATTFTDTNVAQNEASPYTYTYRIKITPVQTSNNASIVVSNCTCGGPCPPANDAQVVSVTVPSTVSPGQSFPAVITMRNNGSSTWTAASGYALNALSPANSAFWQTTTSTPVFGSVANGFTANFVFSLTAPGTSGTYPLNSWQMGQSGSPFGQQTPVQQILVNRSAQGTLDTAACTGFTGWARDPDTTDVLPVRIYQDGPAGSGTLLATITADVNRPDLPWPDKNHGFQWIPPKDTSSHTYYLYAQDAQTGQWIQLNNTPTAPVTCLPPPVVSLSANPLTLPFNSGSSLVSWSVANPTGTTCMASQGTPAWPGTRPLSGGFPSGPLMSSTTFTLTCTNTGGSDSKSVTVSVGSPVPPSATIQTIDQPDYCQAGPEFITTWNYQSDSGLAQGQWQMQVATDPAFSAIVFDSGIVSEPSVPDPVTPPAVSVENGSTGQGALNFNQTYWIRVRSWDSVGTISPWSTAVSAQTPAGPYPAVSFSFDPSPPIVDTDITFTDTSVYGGTPLERQWDFGDGDALDEFPGSGTVVHQYSTIEDGLTARLRVRSDVMQPGQYCEAAPSINVSKPIPQFREVRP